MATIAGLVLMTGQLEGDRQHHQIQPRVVSAGTNSCHLTLTAVLVLLTGSTRETVPDVLLYWSIRVLELKTESAVHTCTPGSDSSGCWN